MLLTHIDRTGASAAIVQALPAGETLIAFSAQISNVTFATLYLWCTIIVPLTVSLLMILWQKPLLSVIWVAVLMAGFMLVVASSIGQFFISAQRLELLNLTITNDAFQAYQIAGISMIAAVLLRNALVSYWDLKIEVRLPSPSTAFPYRPSPSTAFPHLPSPFHRPLFGR